MLDGDRVLSRMMGEKVKRPRAKPRKLEEGLQRCVADFLRRGCPGLIWYAVPNGGLRNKRVAADLKRQGVKAGVPDLAFVLPGGRAAFIELKVGKNDTSDAQESFMLDAEGVGAVCEVCRSVEDVRDVLVMWGVDVRARL